MRFTSLVISILLLALVGCVEPYVPAVLDAPASFLVVDGFINGNGRTRIRLSRTANLAATTPPPVEKGAKLFVVDDAGGRYNLSEPTAGFYQSDSLVLPVGRQYQLRITTAGGATYESALVPLKVTPPIDKLGWQIGDAKVQLLVSTHDASGQARYYHWKLVETWEFNSAFESTFEYFPARNRFDLRITPIHTCWRTERASAISQATTTGLSQDALTDAVIAGFSDRTERVKIRYSALVGQYTETAEEFAYYELLRKNTEAVGTVNDPLPTQLTGNVHRLDNASEPVLGFVGAHTTQYQRIFVDRRDLPPTPDQQFDTPYNGCTETTVYFRDSQGIDHTEEILAQYKLPSNVVTDFVSDPIFGAGLKGGTADCIDCRTRGTNMKPSFW